MDGSFEVAEFSESDYTINNDVIMRGNIQLSDEPTEVVTSEAKGVKGLQGEEILNMDEIDQLLKYQGWENNGNFKAILRAKPDCKS